MYSSSPLPPSSGNADDRKFEQTLRDGIDAAKRGNLSLARTLLTRATTIRVGDARPWLWLSSTTEDPQERRAYLEHAVAADPTNAAARRALVMLSDKLDKSRLVSERGYQTPQQKPEELENATAQPYACPKCGGRMIFDIHKGDLACPYCGYVKETEKKLAPDSAEQAIDFVMPTTRAYTWAQSQQRAECEACGAITVLHAGQTADRCPYCGATRFIRSKQVMELVDPQVIALPKIDIKEASRRARQWLGRGILSPDDLSEKSASAMRLQPAYYPFWTFDGTLEVSWTCEVNVGTNDRPRWEPQSGAEYELFDDVMIPGLRKMSLGEMQSVGPFNLKDLVEFKLEYLAGWNALTYDYPLDQASARAQQHVLGKVTRHLMLKVAAGRQVRNFRTGGGKWVDMTYKLLLLPLYVGNYTYQGKPYRLFVNGQTGKVAGQKPRDIVKTVMVAFGILFLGLILLLMLYVLYLKLP